MAQTAVEIILMRQLAGYLAMPILLFDPEGNLLFYNEPAEAILGRRFEETGEMSLDEWYSIFTLSGEDGALIPAEERPLAIALRKQHAAHIGGWLRGFDGVARRIEATAFPLVGQGGLNLGAIAIFWEADEP